jgi:hypothetical protein
MTIQRRFLLLQVGDAFQVLGDLAVARVDLADDLIDDVAAFLVAFALIGLHNASIPDARLPTAQQEIGVSRAILITSKIGHAQIVALDRVSDPPVGVAPLQGSRCAPHIYRQEIAREPAARFGRWLEILRNGGFQPLYLAAVNRHAPSQARRCSGFRGPQP